MAVGSGAEPESPATRVEGRTSAPEAARLVTVGHGTLAAEELSRILLGAGITSLVDVRSAPGSRQNPQFGRAELERWLPDSGVSYRWEPRLGGFRKADPHSLNVALRHKSFRGYADYMRTPEFIQALDELLSGPTPETTGGQGRRGATACVMCAESVWWRCHRRLIADAATLLRGVETTHLMHDGHQRPHRVTEGARVDDGRLVYDAGVGEMATSSP